MEKQSYRLWYPRLWAVASKGDILFITKSMKDVMCLHEMGIPAVSPSSESTFLPKDVLEQLKTRFKRIIILLIEM